VVALLFLRLQDVLVFLIPFHAKLVMDVGVEALEVLCGGGCLVVVLFNAPFYPPIITCLALGFPRYLTDQLGLWLELVN